MRRILDLNRAGAGFISLQAAGGNSLRLYFSEETSRYPVEGVRGCTVRGLQGQGSRDKKGEE